MLNSLALWLLVGMPTAPAPVTVTYKTVGATELQMDVYSPEGGAKGALEPARDAEDSLFHQHECPACGIKFIEFRNTGRLGCPHDYQAFREELVPLLENIHGETKHCGKVPRRGQHTQEAQNELVQLRQRLKQAVTREDYEEAAKLRDRIKNLEETV